LSNKELRVLKGFIAERTAVIELRNLEKRQKLEALLLGDDRIEINQVSAKSSKHDEYRKKALIDAAKVAKVKAAGLAEVLGSELGQILVIREDKSQFGFNPSFANNIINDDDEASSELEKLSYRATVTVKFELK
jgi:uncharacterized protein